MSRPSPMHARLKPIVVGLIRGFEAEKAADMILRLVLDPEVIGAEPAPSAEPAPGTKRKPGRPVGGGGAGTQGPSIRMPPMLNVPIEEDQQYTAGATAEFLGVQEGTFRSWIAARPDLIEAVRDHDDIGRPRTRFKGSDIIRLRNERIALASAKRG